MEAVDQAPLPVIEKGSSTKPKSRPIARQTSTDAPIAKIASTADGTKKKTMSKSKSTKSAAVKGDSEFKKFSRINSMIAHPTDDSLPSTPVKKFNRTLTIADATTVSKSKKTTTKSALKGSRRASLKAEDTDDDILTPTAGRQDADSSAFEDDASLLSSRFGSSVSLSKNSKTRSKTGSKERLKAADDLPAPSGSEMDSDAPSGNFNRAMTTGHLAGRGKSSTSSKQAPSGQEPSRTLTTPKEQLLKSSLKKSASQKGGVPPGLPSGSVASDGGASRSPRNAGGPTRGAPGPSNMSRGTRTVPHSQSDSGMQEGGADYAMQQQQQQQQAMMMQQGYQMQGGMGGMDGWAQNVQGNMMGGMNVMGQAGMMLPMPPQQQVLQQVAQTGQETDISLLPMLPLPSMPQIVQCQRCNQLLEVPQILPPAKKGVQKLRCGKCLRVSRFRENPADPRSSSFGSGADGDDQPAQRPTQLGGPLPMGAMGSPGAGMGPMQQPFPNQPGMRPPGQQPFNPAFPQQGMPPGMGFPQGPFMGGPQYGMNPQMMGQQYGQFPQQIGQMGQFGYTQGGQMGYMPPQGMMSQGTMNQGYPQGMNPGMMGQGGGQGPLPHMQQHQQQHFPQQQPQPMRKSGNSPMPSPTVEDSDNGSVVVKRGPRGPGLAGPGSQSGRLKGSMDGQGMPAQQQFPRSSSGSARGPQQQAMMHRVPGSMESGDSGLSAGSGSTFPMLPMGAGGYSTGGSGGQITFIRRVSVNGEAVPDDIVQVAEDKSGPIQPGNYWYDEVAGFWGQMGGPCLGIIPPGINFGAHMPRNCANGSTSILVNGRELHVKDLERLMKRGLPTVPNCTYRIEINGNVFDEQSGNLVMSLGKLAPSLETRKRGTGMKMPEVAVQ